MNYPPTSLLFLAYALSEEQAQALRDFARTDRVWEFFCFTSELLEDYLFKLTAEAQRTQRSEDRLQRASIFFYEEYPVKSSFLTLIHPIGCMRSPHLESTLKAETIVSGYSHGRTIAKIAMIAFNYKLVTDLSKGRRVDEAIKLLHIPGLLSKIVVNGNYKLMAICFGRAW